MIDPKATCAADPQGEQAPPAAKCDFAERVSVGLVSAPPPAGLEDRIMATLHAAQAHDPATRPLQRWLLMPTLAAAVLIVIVFGHRSHRAPLTPAHSSVANPPRPAAASLTTQAAVVVPPRSADRGQAGESSGLNKTSEASKTSEARDGAMAPAVDLAALAAEEAAAPSQATPPLRLTADERAIRQFSQYASAFQQAELNRPEVLAAQEQLERERSERYFAPRPEPTGNGPLIATGPDQPDSFVPASVPAEIRQPQ